jgi:hypothetical protein
MQRHWPPLVAAFLFCAAGVLRIWQEGREGYLLAGAGLVAFGVWLGQEVLSGNDNERKGDGDGLR